MDDQITMQPITPSVPPQETSYNHKKRFIVIISIVILVIILAAIGWYLWKKHHAPVTVTPAQTLQDLRASSAPDKKTIDQKSATMNALQKSSAKSSVTSQQQMDMLNSLHK